MQRNYEAIALCVLTAPTFEDAAQRAGISISTLRRYRKNPDFQKALSDVKQSTFREAMQKCQTHSLEALEILMDIARDEGATDSSRVSAARGVLDLGAQCYSVEMIETELAELRKAVLGSD